LRIAASRTACSRIADKCRNCLDIVDTTLRPIFSSLLKSAICGVALAHRSGRLIALADCHGLVRGKCSKQKKGSLRLAGFAGYLERGQLMSSTGTDMEGTPAVRPGFFGEHAQELDSVVSRYLPMFHKRAFQFLGNTTDAEDAVQDALLSAYKHLGQFRGQAQLSTWLTTIVTNAARMQLRRRRGGYLSLDEQQGEDGLTLSERLADSRPGQEEVCSTAELHAQLVNGAKQLSPTLRRAFQLRHIEGLTPKEAARVLGIPEGTVKAQLARARSKLAEIMKVAPARRRSRRSLSGWRPLL
jgi:RNA polymerase sigma-70 factor (ECF subfamily)